MEKLRTSATARDSEADAIYWKSYGHWKTASPHGSFYSDEISKAVQELDPLVQDIGQLCGPTSNWNRTPTTTLRIYNRRTEKSAEQQL